MDVKPNLPLTAVEVFVVAALTALTVCAFGGVAYLVAWVSSRG